MSLFLTIVLTVWTAMHGYVFWRLATIPWLATYLPRKGLVLAATLLWLSYPITRFLEGRAPDWLILPLEYVAANWIGFLFLLMCWFLFADVATLGGFVFRPHIGAIRTAAAAIALVLGCVALIQGHRRPVVTSYEVVLEGLPSDRDGTVVVAISDLHLGTLIGKRWLERLVADVNLLKPNMVVAVGDLVDGNALRVRALPPVLRELKAPLGLWAVTGNHEFYAGVRSCVDFFESSGMRVLQDEAVEAAPGLVVAGVHDLTARSQFGDHGNPVHTTLSNRPAGATIFLSHSPWQMEQAAAAGAGLMISGHTHNGQIWPFSHLVRTRYPYINGLYQIGGMKLAVARGAGTWGPRMRLWHAGEILRFTLRSKKQA